MSGPADFKSVPGFENEPRFVGVIEQNKIQRTFFHYCIIVQWKTLCNMYSNNKKKLSTIDPQYIYVKWCIDP